jgi:hypothetical protein
MEYDSGSSEGAACLKWPGVFPTLSEYLTMFYLWRWIMAVSAEALAKLRKIVGDADSDQWC